MWWSSKRQGNEGDGVEGRQGANGQRVGEKGNWSKQFADQHSDSTMY